VIDEETQIGQIPAIGPARSPSGRPGSYTCDQAVPSQGVDRDVAGIEADRPDVGAGDGADGEELAGAGAACAAGPTADMPSVVTARR